MVGDTFQVEVGGLDAFTGHAGEFGGQGLGRTRPRGPGHLGRGRRCRHRHEVAAQRFGQGADQRGDQLVAQTGDLPVETGVVDLVEVFDGDVRGHAVESLPGSNW